MSAALPQEAVTPPSRSPRDRQSNVSLLQRFLTVNHALLRVPVRELDKLVMAVVIDKVGDAEDGRRLLKSSVNERGEPIRYPISTKTLCELLGYAVTMGDDGKVERINRSSVERSMKRLSKPLPCWREHGGCGKAHPWVAVTRRGKKLSNLVRVLKCQEIPDDQKFDFTPGPRRKPPVPKGRKRSSSGPLFEALEAQSDVASCNVTPPQTAGDAKRVLALAIGVIHGFTIPPEVLDAIAASPCADASVIAHDVELTGRQALTRGRPFTLEGLLEVADWLESDVASCYITPPGFERDTAATGPATPTAGATVTSLQHELHERCFKLFVKGSPKATPEQARAFTNDLVAKALQQVGDDYDRATALVGRIFRSQRVNDAAKPIAFIRKALADGYLWSEDLDSAKPAGMYENTWKKLPHGSREIVARVYEDHLVYGKALDTAQLAQHNVTSAGFRDWLHGYFSQLFRS